MNKLIVIALIPLMAGCNACRTHTASTDRAMLSRSNIPDVQDGPMERVHFAYDSSALSDASKSVIKDNLAWLKLHGSSKVELGGNCDERGTNEYNMALGMKRANSTLNYIKALGTDSVNYTAVSYGEEMPVDPAHNETAWAKNRCVEFNNN